MLMMAMALTERASNAAMERGLPKHQGALFYVPWLVLRRIGGDTLVNTAFEAARF